MRKRKVIESVKDSELCESEFVKEVYQAMCKAQEAPDNLTTIDIVFSLIGCAQALNKGVFYMAIKVINGDENDE